MAVQPYIRGPVPMETIQDYVDRLVAEFQPEKVILFGSHAAGTAHEDSDVDLLVVMNFEGRRLERVIDMRVAVPRSFTLDLLLLRPSETETGGNWITRAAVREGRVIYEASRCSTWLTQD